MEKTPEQLNAENVTAADLAAARATQQRKYAYPPLEDQLDMLWHAMNDDPALRLEPFYSALKDVKQRFPKN